MKSWRTPAFFLLLVVLFLAANRAAYKGYFSDDDFDNLSWTRVSAPTSFLNGLVSPKFAEFNFRPVGHLWYHVMGRTVGLRFPYYIGALHLLHLVNLVILWFLLKSLGATRKGVMAGVALYAFHVAAFDAWWRPMFNFDVFCATFTLLALLLYVRGHWLWALLPFWLGYKSKELAAALPALLLVYEWYLGGRRWKRVIPFLVVSASFAVQGIRANTATDNAYTLRFTLDAVWRTFQFYSTKILLFPYLGIALLAAFFATHDKRIRFGLLTIALLMGPLWFLPGRLFAVYLYVPLIGLAIAFTFFAERVRAWCLVTFFLVWWTGNFLLLRHLRSDALAEADGNRGYAAAVQTFLAQNPDIETVVFDGAPPRLNPWGVRGIFHWYAPRQSLRIAGIRDAEARELLASPNVALASWNGMTGKLVTAVRRPGQPEESFIEMAVTAPLWQFLDGWFPLENGYRWVGPTATARLNRAPAAREFEVTVNTGPGQIKEQGPIVLEVLLDGVSLGTRVYDKEGWRSQRWPVPPGNSGPVVVELRVANPFKPASGDPRLLGAAIAAFGFIN